jgi:hypothetical protein
MKIIACYNYLSLFFFLFLNLQDSVKSHKACGIDFLKKPQRVLIKQENENRMLLEKEEWEPIRIHLDFSYIENNIGRMKKQDYIDLKEKIMPKTQDVFQKLLKVKRIQHKLKLNAPHCETFPIPEMYHQSGEGVDADIVIFVLLDDTGFFSENKIEAAAIHCLQHYETRRPIAGYIQFKQDLNVNNSTALDYMVWLAIHEVSHILVINNALYEDYIDSNTLQPYGYDRIIGQKDSPNGKKMNIIKSKNVLEKARKHFGCDNLDGVPLEYNGGVGTAGSHWAKKFMNTDYMIGDSYGENVISEITLGLFEDSGWYKIDYDLANLFLWGKNTGCDFFEKKCIKQKANEVMTDFPREYCTKLNYPICSPGNVFRASCFAKKYKSELNKYEQFFDDPKIGGVDSLTGRCPIPFEEKNGQKYYGGSCRVGNTHVGKLEKVCPECACFMSTLNFIDEEPSKRLERIFNLRRNSVIFSENQNLMKSPPKRSESLTNNTLFVSNSNPSYFDEDPLLTSEDPLASCYEFKCDDGELKVAINGDLFKCPSNEKITIRGYRGFIFCPDNDVMCNKKYKCKFGCTEMYENLSK